MPEEIVHTTTVDHLPLDGLYLSGKEKKGILVFVHGTASNFYENDFIYPLLESLPNLGWSILSTNNRGNGVLQAYPQPHGAALEKFEDCILDIDAWMKWALKKGYSKVILCGHSLGSEKVIYYAGHGTYRKRLWALILLGFTDSFGTQQRFLKKNKKGKALWREAKRSQKQKKGNQLLTTVWKSHAGILPKSADSYINFFDPHGALAQNFPLSAEKKLKQFAQLRLNILAVMGEKDHWALSAPRKEIQRLEKENPYVSGVLIPRADHCFTGKEKEVVKEIIRFVKKEEEMELVGKKIIQQEAEMKKKGLRYLTAAEVKKKYAFL